MLGPSARLRGPFSFLYASMTDPRALSLPTRSALFSPRVTAEVQAAEREKGEVTAEVHSAPVPPQGTCKGTHQTDAARSY